MVKLFNENLLEKKRNEFTSKEAHAEQKRREFEEYLEKVR